jgi:hypothetical protein
LRSILWPGEVQMPGCAWIHTQKSAPWDPVIDMLPPPPHPPERAVLRRASAGWASKLCMWPHVVLIKSSNQFKLFFVSLQCVLSDLCRRWLQPDINVMKLTILRRLKLGPVLATEGESHQTKTHYHCRWCVEGNDSRGEVFDDGKQTNGGAVG